MPSWLVLLSLVDNVHVDLTITGPAAVLLLAFFLGMLAWRSRRT